MADMVRDFALQLLRRLHTSHKATVQTDGDADMDEEGQLQAEDILQTPYLPEQLTIPAERMEMLQHVELLFALCVKGPELLDEYVFRLCKHTASICNLTTSFRIFDAYGGMHASVQDAVQDLITPMIKSLGAGHARLLTCLRKFPPGADGLVLRVIKIFTDNQRPSAPLVALVKGIIAERSLDVRFLVPIIAEMDKTEIVKHLPRVIATLDGTPENKALVRTVFNNIVATPAQAFGSTTSNMPRVRQSELLTPAELMIMLHESDKDIGLKATIEGQYFVTDYVSDHSADEITFSNWHML
jgi:symplekin